MKVEISINIADQTKIAEAVTAVGTAITTLAGRFKEITNNREFSTHDPFTVGFRKPGTTAYFYVSDATVTAVTATPTHAPATTPPVTPPQTIPTVATPATPAPPAPPADSSDEAEVVEEVEVKAPEKEVKKEAPKKEAPKKAVAKKKPVGKKKTKR